MKNIIAILFLGLLTDMSLQASESNTIKIMHYNIKELDTVKIDRGSNDQFKAVKVILDSYEFDILSLNEIQYDLPSVPTRANITKGQNLDKLRSEFSLKTLVNDAFYPANTGNNAIPKSNGDYYQDPSNPKARKNADKVNFGTMPSQYSTGALFKFKKINEVVVSKLKWKEFNPKLNLNNYADVDGNPMPENMELFDKNFTDVTVDVNGKDLHIILLHTVPAFHFGNMKSVNYKRNEDQLKFLEWYTTGSTDFKVKINGIKPLAKDAYYVATGDFNTSFNDKVNPGSAVLRRMFTKSKLWTGDKSKLSFTNEGAGYGTNPFRLMLDYIAYSNNIEMISGKIIHPNFERIQLGCNGSNNTSKPAGMIKVSWNERNKICSAFVHPDYKTFKDASDHYPILGEFRLK
jgi:hypothetical protein